MAYVVKADANFQTIPVADYSQEQSIDFTTVPFIQVPVPYDDYPISQSDPSDLWKGNGGYVKTNGQVPPPQNVICYFPYQTMFRSEYTHTGLDSRYNASRNTSLYMCSVHCPDGKLRVYYVIVDSVGDAINLLSSSWSSNDHVLYVNDFEDAVTDILEDTAAWDDTPSTDPQNNPDKTLPEGGEFADTDPFGFGNTDIDLPDIIQEMDYSGFITPYKLDNGGLFALAGGIFSNDTWTTLKNKFNGVGNPIDYIVSAVEIPYSATADATKNFNLGGVDVVNGSGNNVPLPYFTHRYEKLSFGSLTLKETWGTEKDYSTTNVSIYLPYVGVKDLDTAILMNSTITLAAILDIWSGDLLYVLRINNKSMAYKYLASSGLVYRFQGNCGKQVPIGKVDNSNQLMAMTGSMASMGVGLVTGNPMAAFGGAAGLIGAAAMSPKVSMTGGITGAIGRGDTNEPYLIITQSVPVYPKNWRAHFGAPRYQEFTLGSLSGFVKCADVHAESIEGANDAERAAIEQVLKAGVFMP